MKTDAFPALIDPQTERFILANALAYTESMDEARPVLDALHFSLNLHRILWLTLCDIYDQGDAITPQTVYNRVIERGQAHHFNGMVLSWVAELQAEASPTGSGDSIRVLSDKLLKRQAFAAAEATRAACLDPTVPAQAVLDAWVGQARSLGQREADGTLTDYGRVVERCGGTDEFYHPPARTGVHLPLPGLRKILGGLHPGELTVLSGLTGTGKSALAAQIALACAERGGSVLFFTLEMTSRDVFFRIAIQKSRISSDRVKENILTRGEQLRIEQTGRELESLPIFVGDRFSTLAQIHAKIRQYRIMNPDLGLVVIDHLHLLKPPATRDSNRNRQLGDMARDIKIMASTEFNLPILLLAQLTRKVTERPDKLPTMEDLRDSGEIEQHADNILLIGLEGKDESAGLFVPTQVDIAKHRAGKKGIIKTYFRGDLFSFVERDSYNTEEPPPQNDLGFSGPPPSGSKDVH
jgi:replicative DNA helicase